MHSLVRIGTRGSRLALWQARAVASRIEQHGAAVELVIVKTAGDRLQEAPLSEAGGKRLFVKELEDALLRDEIDLAVHSAKDMSAVLPDGLTVAATLPREDPRDGLVLPLGKPGGTAASLIAGLTGARIGTSSVRRMAQLARLVPGARFEPVRGNVDTRLRKLDEGQYDALVLACAGLNRLGFGERISAAIAPGDCLPAPGQGIIAIETRAGGVTAESVRKLHDEPAGFALDAERAVVEALGGGCQLPLGALAVLNGASLDVQAVVCSTDGAEMMRARASGRPSEARGIGERIAAELEAQGAGRLLAALRPEEPS